MSGDIPVIDQSGLSKWPGPDYPGKQDLTEPWGPAGMAPFSIIIPANNEAGYIGPCLQALLDQSDAAGPLQIIVVANACTDTTVAEAQVFIPQAESRGWQMVVLDLSEGGKPNALNAGDKTALGKNRAYLDADILCDPDLFFALGTALETDTPCYATGRLCLRPARSHVTRAYGRFWQLLPFVQDGAVGAGMYARWETYPDIISDDTFARLQFGPSERVEVAPAYHWPLVEGFQQLVKVRRRQDAGVQELAQHFPDVIANEGKSPLTLPGLIWRAVRAPVGFAVYVAVALAVRSARDTGNWARGR